MLADYGNLSHDFCIEPKHRFRTICRYRQHLPYTFRRGPARGAWQAGNPPSTLAMMTSLTLFHIRAQRHANPRPYYRQFRTFDSPAFSDRLFSVSRTVRVVQSGISILYFLMVNTRGPGNIFERPAVARRIYRK